MNKNEEYYRKEQKLSEKELIQWPVAKWWNRSWSPIIGCQPISPACENCWACEWAKRFNQSFEPHASSKKNPPQSGVVFCGGLTDMFGDWNDSPFTHIAKTMKSANREATYIYLTKRVERMCAVLREIVSSEPMDTIFANHYFGFTAENQEWFDRRMGQAVGIPAWANLWLSAEPLLGPMEPIVGSVFNWVVVGCESGRNRRPCKIEWVEHIVEICRDNRVPVFVKQLDIGGKCVTDIEKFPEHLRIRQVPWADKREVK